MKIEKNASPLQRAQRDRQSIIFQLSGGVNNAKKATEIALNQRKHLFTEEEIAAMQQLQDVCAIWQRANSNIHRPGYSAWEEVKKNLAASVDNAEKKV